MGHNYDPNEIHWDVLSLHDLFSILSEGGEIETWVMPWPPMLRCTVCVFVTHTSHDMSTSYAYTSLIYYYVHALHMRMPITKWLGIHAIGSVDKNNNNIMCYIR